MMRAAQAAKTWGRIIQEMFDGVMALSPQGRIVAANPAMERILGEKNLVGKTLEEALGETGRNEELKSLIREAIGGKARDALVPFAPRGKGQENHLRARVCPLTGEGLAAALIVGDKTELVALRDAFGRYIPGPVLDQLLGQPDGLCLGGRREELTILMSDLRGFTSLSEVLAPEALIAMLNHYLGEMTEAIEGQKGTIIEFIGDGILAVFGGGQGALTHAEDAVAAALDMQRRMLAVNDWNKKNRYPALEMGIAVHTGQAILGNIGSEKRTKYGVVGAAVNMTGRLESVTIGGEVLISDATLRQVHCSLQVVRRMEILPKGLLEPLVCYQVSAIGEPYKISYPLPEEGLVPLKTSLIVRFSHMEGKTRSREVFLGQVRARSKRELLLSSQEPLEEYENITLEIPGEKTYSAKILARRPGGYLVHLTSGEGREL